MTVVSKEIFGAGKAAKAAGGTDADNPYPAGSQESLDWLEGFTADEPDPTAAGPDEAA